MLGTDVTPLLAHYDERYADAPINPRRVFEAELGSGGAIRATRGGPNWSVLIAAVMALVLAWSVARLITDSPVELRDPVPQLSTAGSTSAGDPVPVVLTAAGGGAEVVVRDGSQPDALAAELSRLLRLPRSGSKFALELATKLRADEPLPDDHCDDREPVECRRHQPFPDETANRYPDASAVRPDGSPPLWQIHLPLRRVSYEES